MALDGVWSTPECRARSDCMFVQANLILHSPQKSSMVAEAGSGLTYPDPEGRIFNPVISDIPVVLKATTLTFSGSMEKVSPVESKILTVMFP